MKNSQFSILRSVPSKRSLSSLMTVALLPFILNACSGDKDSGGTIPGGTIPGGTTPNGTTAGEYRITVVNVSHNQPLSPVAVVLHEDDYSAWSIGSPASDGLEMLAESGSPTDFIAEATTALDTEAGTGPIFAGDREVIEVSTTDISSLKLTIASMPINTNDAFTGVTGWDISALAVGESVKKVLPIYDAGTEMNTEADNTIPGPADQGEGYNAARDDIADQVTRHPGVVTQADGYTDSILTESHRFDNGVMRVTVERIN